MENQIKNTIRYHFILTRKAIVRKMEVNIGKNVEKLEPLDVAARNVKH